MSFTIKCNKCGQEQELKLNDYYNKEKVSLEVDPWTDEYWDSLSIGCNNCGNLI